MKKKTRTLDALRARGAAWGDGGIHWCSLRQGRHYNTFFIFETRLEPRPVQFEVCFHSMMKCVRNGSLTYPSAATVASTTKIAPTLPSTGFSSVMRARWRKPRWEPKQKTTTTTCIRSSWCALQACASVWGCGEGGCWVKGRFKGTGKTEDVNWS